MDYFEAVQTRRTVYNIGKNTNISQDKIIEIIEKSIKNTPTAFNSQNQKVIVLFGNNHDVLWDMVLDSFPIDIAKENEEKINSFKSGLFTVLFFEDLSVVKGLQEKFPLYSDNFPRWSIEAVGMLQYIIWTGLHGEGLVGSVQHYSNLIEHKVNVKWSVPKDLKLISQMVFGSKESEPDSKTFEPLESRLFIYK